MRHHPGHGAGVSLVEVLVGMLILSILAVAAIGWLTHASREADVMSDHTLALLLSQKVFEEAFQAVHDDAWADLLLEQEAGPARPIAKAQAPFFRALEDTGPPYGRLTAIEDLAVDARDPVLLRFYQHFRFGFACTPGTVRELPGAPALLLELSLRFSWPAAHTTGSSLGMQAVLARPRIAPRLDEDGPGGDALEAAIVTQLAPDRAGQPLAAVAGEDVTVARELGTIVVVLNHARALLRAAGEAAVPDTPAAQVRPSERHRRRGRAAERVAGAALGALVLAARRARPLAARIEVARVPVLRPEVKDGIRQVLASAGELRTALLEHSAIALELYLRSIRARRPSSSRAYRDLLLDRKVLELIEMRHFLTGSTDLAYLRAYIDNRLDVHRDRNRWFQHQLEHEFRHAATLDALVRLHPGPHARAAAAIGAEGALTELATAVARLPVR